MKSELVFPVWEIWFSSSKGYAIRLLWNSSWMKKKSLIVYLRICNMCNMCKSSRWSDIKLFTRALWISSKMVSNVSIIVKTFLLHFRDKYGHFWIMIWLATNSRHPGLKTEYITKWKLESHILLWIEQKIINMERLPTFFNIHCDN